MALSTSFWSATLGFREGLLWFGLALQEKFGFCRDQTLGRSLGEVSIVDLGVDLGRC